MEKTKTISITLTQEDWDQLEKTANEEDYDVESYIQELVSDDIYRSW